MWHFVRVQIETVLHKILHELKVLYARHAPQLKPRKTSTGKSSSATSSSASSRGSSSNSSSEQLSSEPMLTDACGGCNGGNTGLADISSLDVVDPVTDVYNILEGSALVPFTEVCHSVPSYQSVCPSVYLVGSCRAYNSRMETTSFILAAIFKGKPGFAASPFIFVSACSRRDCLVVSNASFYRLEAFLLPSQQCRITE